MDGVYDMLSTFRKNWRPCYLCRWARELSHSEQLPISLRETPLKHALLIQYLDEILNIRIRKKFGTRFPAFLSDLKSREKDYFIQTLEQDSTISKIFLPDVEEGAERLSIGLKMWVGGIAGAKGTRKTHNAAKGEEDYSPEQRRADFEAADNYAKKDEIFHAGVQVATILEGPFFFLPCSLCSTIYIHVKLAAACSRAV